MNNKVSSKILTKGFRLLEELQPTQPESSFQNTFCKLNEFLLLFQQIPLVIEKLHINIKYLSLLSCCAPSSSSSPSPPPPPTPPPSLWPGWRCTWGLSWQPRSSQKEGLSANWTKHKTAVSGYLFGALFHHGLADVRKSRHHLYSYGRYYDGYGRLATVREQIKVHLFFGSGSLANTDSECHGN